MENNLDLLKHIYHEDLYIVDEPKLEQVHEVPAKEEVDDMQADASPVVEEQQPVQFLGRNAKGILILVNDTESELLNQTDLDFLMKVVESGLRYSKNDFALVNAARFPVSQALEEVPYTNILSFGVSLPLSGADSSTYQVIEIENNKVMQCHSLREIAADQGKKKMLWSSLKSMFNIS